MAAALVGLTVLAVSPRSSLAETVSLFDETSLAAIIWRTAPEVLAARRALDDAEGVRDRSYLLPNPTLTATWATIPIGARPMNVPFGAVPSYTAEIAELIEIGKRSPRQRAAEAARDASRHLVRDAYVRTFFAVMEALSDQAAATARMAVLERLARDSAESLRLQHARAEKGDIAQLEVDRLEVEHSRLLSAIGEAAATREVSALACALLLGSPCPQFTITADARRFLETHARQSPPDQPPAIASRPDLQALRAERAQLEAELTLARRQPIPDVVASVGFTHDQFAAAGNQASSVSVSLSIPLPMFDRGQTEASRVRRRLATNEGVVRSLTAGAAQALAIQRQQLATLRNRERLLDEQAVPRARSVVERTEAAFQRGGLSFSEVLLARRAAEELELDRIEVASAAHRARLTLRRLTAAVPSPPASSSALRDAAPTP